MRVALMMIRLKSATITDGCMVILQDLCAWGQALTARSSMAEPLEWLCCIDSAPKDELAQRKPPDKGDQAEGEGPTGWF
jgi:hypothetical protein